MAMAFTGTATTSPATDTFDTDGPKVLTMYIKNTSADTDLLISVAGVHGGDFDTVAFGDTAHYSDQGGIPSYQVKTSSGTATYTAAATSV